MSHSVDWSWKALVLKLMDKYAKRTQGAIVENKVNILYTLVIIGDLVHSHRYPHVTYHACTVSDVCTSIPWSKEREEKRRERKEKEGKGGKIERLRYRLPVC